MFLNWFFGNSKTFLFFPLKRPKILIIWTELWWKQQFYSVVPKVTTKLIQNKIANLQTFYSVFSQLFWILTRKKKMTDMDMFSRIISVGLVCGVLYLLPFLLFFCCITSITKMILLMLMMMLILCLIMIRPANWLCNAGNRSQPATN